MPLSRSRNYLSIGEVLDAVRSDFPDVSISKIRFLETEGLLAPERTPSGYRKFYEKDVERLRYILSLQKDQFLPLKVIKERLANGNGSVSKSPSGGGDIPPRPSADAGAKEMADLTALQLSRKELQRASGLDDASIKNLEDFGLLVCGPSGSFDGTDLILAKAYAGFFGFGVEARHLKMYKQFADREAALFEQMVTPLARKKSGEGAREAAGAAAELMALSKKVRDALLRSTLRELL
jgi:DNA-binding transcriptional MerR regulator